MSNTEDDSHWRRALTEVRSTRHVRVAGTAEEENKDPFSESYLPSQKWNCAGSAKSFERMERCCCCISRVLSIFYFFWERAEGCRIAAQYCAAVICKQASFYKCPTGITVPVMLPFCLLLPDNPRVGHSSAPPSWSAQLLTWSVSKHRAVNA